MRKKPDEPLSVNRVAELLGVDYWKVRYIVNARRFIKPAVVIQSMQFYDAKAIRQIKVELNMIDAKAKRRAASVL